MVIKKIWIDSAKYLDVGTSGPTPQKNSGGQKIHAQPRKFRLDLQKSRWNMKNQRNIEWLQTAAATSARLRTNLRS